MSEGHNGGFEKGHHPSSGELQARAAEKIIEGAQRKTQESNRGAFGAAGTSASASAREHGDSFKLENVRNAFKQLDEWKAGLKKTPSNEGAPRLITPHGVATTHEEVDRLFEEQRKESEKNFERMRKESAARLNTFWRLPFGEKLSMLISGSPTDMDKYNEILEQERKRQGL